MQLPRGTSHAAWQKTAMQDTAGGETYAGSAGHNLFTSLAS